MIRPILRDISAATLILRGEEDEIATGEHQANMKNAIVLAEFIPFAATAITSIGKPPKR